MTKSNETIAIKTLIENEIEANQCIDNVIRYKSDESKGKMEPAAKETENNETLKKAPGRIKIVRTGKLDQPRSLY